MGSRYGNYDRMTHNLMEWNGNLLTTRLSEVDRSRCRIELSLFRQRDKVMMNKSSVLPFSCQIHAKYRADISIVGNLFNAIQTRNRYGFLIEKCLYNCSCTKNIAVSFHVYLSSRIKNWTKCKWLDETVHRLCDQFDPIAITDFSTTKTCVMRLPAAKVNHIC